MKSEKKRNALSVKASSAMTTSNAENTGKEAKI
jgi:hypothetical protein